MGRPGGQALLDYRSEPTLSWHQLVRREMSNPIKGLILAGGKGSRLRPFTYTGAKQLVPIANKPVLFYAIEQLVAAGVADIGIVVGETGDQVRAAGGGGAAVGARGAYNHH